MTLETRIRSNNNNSGGGGAQVNTSAIVYAPTGGSYVTYVADAQLASEKVLTASNNVTITTDGNAIYISAITNSATGGSGASTAGNYITFLADAGLSNDKVLTASNNIQITTGAGTVFITALTPTLTAQSGGTVYAPTGGNYIAFLADSDLSNEKVLTASNNIQLTTSATAVFVTALTPTVVPQSGGTVYAYTGGNYVLYDESNNILPNGLRLTGGDNAFVTTGFGFIFVNAITSTVIAQSGGTVYAPTGGNYIAFLEDSDLTNEKVLTASNNITITTDGTSVFITALTPTVVAQSGGTVYAPTGGNYVAFLADANLSNEKVLTASNNITITTDATTIWLSANTGASGASVTYAPTGGEYVTWVANNTLTNEKVLTASNNITITTGASTVLISANTGATIFFAPSNAPYITFLADSTLSNEKILTASNNIQITTGATQVYLTALTANAGAFASTGTTLTAGSGLSGGGNLSANREFSVNTNVRDKIYSFFGPLALSTTMAVEEIRIRIPFNCQPIRCDLALTTTPLVSGITCDLLQFTTPTASGTTIFSTSGNKPQILANSASGFTTTFDTTVLHAGSYLGMRILQVGSATAQGSNLTLTLIVRSS